jgi:hypothetical protein
MMADQSAREASYCYTKWGAFAAAHKDDVPSPATSGDARAGDLHTTTDIVARCLALKSL